MPHPIAVARVRGGGNLACLHSLSVVSHAAEPGAAHAQLCACHAVRHTANHTYQIAYATPISIGAPVES